MSRVLGRRPLGQRNINTESGSSSSSSKSTSFAPTLTKKDSRCHYERKSSCSSLETSNNENNKALTSLSSETLRRVISNADLSTCADTGQAVPSVLPSIVKQPSFKNTSSVSTLSDESIKSQEKVTIIEHRKRPCGDGYTVHKYERGKLLGKGGFAKVYKVTSLDTNKEYAIKIVPKANLVKSRARQKLQTEIKIHRTMKHPHICEYKHFFEDKTNCYILLELCDNHSMNEMIKRRKTLTEEETRFFMLQIIDAVSYMHEANVIHRDLKLGNLFLSKHLSIKVGDFGLATRLESSDEKRKTICGTPNYIAPEVINGDKEKRGHSFEVDTWSMGVICYTMIVGKPPYESTDVKSTYRRILANEYSFPEGKVSKHARALIFSMLQTDPKMRPSMHSMKMHPFFSLRIPITLPPTCTMCEPIWSSDEFGELHAVAPTSALDINIPKKPLTHVCSPQGGETNYKFCENTEPVVPSNVVPAPTTLSSSTRFNIFDDLSEQLDRKLCLKVSSKSDSLIEKIEGPTYNAKHMNRLADRNDEHVLVKMKCKSSPHFSEENEYDEALKDEVNERQIESLRREHLNLENLDDLELIHNCLIECLKNYEHIQNGGSRIESSSSVGIDLWGPTKWVTRYVDYTSKYGLGFLLNDRSSGVYFNDSTKAVLSAADDQFLYIERKKSLQGSSEPISAYTLNNYPVDSLKKKVTLLQHFRSYLTEQQHRAEGNGEAEPLTGNFDQRQNTTTVNMVFIKKWIRTKHAMLFRLSDGTVQVLFYDFTEVLISAKGKVVTYVDKEKKRFVHSIIDIANNQHSDILKRLKYAKEILAQLIPASKC